MGILAVGLSGRLVGTLPQNGVLMAGKAGAGISQGWYMPDQGQISDLAVGQSGQLVCIWLRHAALMAGKAGAEYGLAGRAQA